MSWTKGKRWGRVDRVDWTCPVCRRVLQLRPKQAARRKQCSRACRNTARFHSKQQQINRLKRVMFVHGYTESEALAYLRGWRAGRSAAMCAYLHGKRLTARVGSKAWEKAVKHRMEEKCQQSEISSPS